MNAFVLKNLRRHHDASKKQLPAIIEDVELGSSLPLPSIKYTGLNLTIENHFHGSVGIVYNKE